MKLGKAIFISFAIPIAIVVLANIDSDKKSPPPSTPYFSPTNPHPIGNRQSPQDLDALVEQYTDRAAMKSDPIVQKIWAILGSDSSNSGSGLVHVYRVHAGHKPTNITYRWMPFWNTDARTCAIDMNSHIQRLYSQTPKDLDTINFTIEVPIDNNNGTYTWKTRYTFTVTRAAPNPNFSD